MNMRAVRILLAGLIFAATPLLAQVQPEWVPTGKVYDLGGRIKLPSVKSPVEKEASAPKVTKSGVVQFRFIVDETGEPRLVHMVRTTDPDLVEAALWTLLRTRYNPATLDGRPVAVHMFLDLNLSPK